MTLIAKDTHTPGKSQKKLQASLKWITLRIAKNIHSRPNLHRQAKEPEYV